MEAMTVIIIIFVVIYFTVKVSKKSRISNSVAKSSNRKVSSQKKSKLDNDLEWLKRRWKLAEAQQQAGSTEMFPKWYFDEVTEQQLNKLDKFGVVVKNTKITKGQASDWIGMHVSADEKSLDILRFFKMPVKGMNQTKALHEIALIFQDQQKAESWKKRPPSKIQKEYLNFFGIKPKKGMTSTEASKLISSHESDLAEREDPQLDEWEAFNEIIDELSDPEIREDYEIKKPSMTLIKQALAGLQKEGKSYCDVAGNIDLVIDKIIELKPELRRS